VDKNIIIIMKALYLLFHGFAPHNGISKKVFYQVSALKSCGLDVELCYLLIDSNGYQKRMVGERVIDNYGNGYSAKILKWFHFTSVSKYILDNSIEFVYIRSFNNANPFLISMMRKMRRANVKVVLEIPTYPYDNEFKESPLADKVRFYINKLFRNQLKGSLDRIITFTDLSEIHGVKTINISNGVDFDSVRLKKSIDKKKGDAINLIGVAEIHYWHGFDRLIMGLGDYYRSCPDTIVNFMVVGEGRASEVQTLKEMVASIGISEHVFFYGNQFGEDLDHLFDEADFGIASLGRHRSGITKIKTLKNREYAARGLPFIYSEQDDDFEGMPYIIKAPADESHIDVHKLIEFYRSIRLMPSDIRASICNTLSWKVQMQKVIDLTFN